MLLMEVLRTWGFGVGLGVSAVTLVLFIIRKKLPWVGLFFVFTLLALVPFSYVATLYHDYTLASFRPALACIIMAGLIFFIVGSFIPVTLNFFRRLQLPFSISEQDKIVNPLTAILVISFTSFVFLIWFFLYCYPNPNLSTFRLFIASQVFVWLAVMVTSTRIKWAKVTLIKWQEVTEWNEHQILKTLFRKRFSYGLLFTILLGTVFEAFRGLWLIWFGTGVWLILISVSLWNMLTNIGLTFNPPQGR